MSSIGRCVIQQCVSAKLMVKPAEENEPAQYVQIQRGVVIFVCFLKDATLDCLPKIVKSILEVKLSFSDEQQKRLSILELPGDVLIVPQATLGGKMKGKMIQYHNNVAKDLGNELYTQFITQMKDTFDENKQKQTSKNCVLHHGTYGNLQVLNMDTNGPYTTIIDF